MGCERILSAVLKKIALFFALESDFFKNIGRIVNKQTIAKIDQLYPSIKLTDAWFAGLINNSAAAAIIPNTDKRNVCIALTK